MSLTNDCRLRVSCRSAPVRRARRLPGRRILACVTAACLLAPLAFAGAATAQVQEDSDRHALVALFDGTDGSSWDRRDNWGSELPLDQWYGVTTDAAGRVTRLDLPSNGLSGEIPDEISYLTDLKHLDLGGNELFGEIPVLVGKLRKLEVLDLQNNRLDRQIPDTPRGA